MSRPHRHEDKILLVLTLIIGAVVGLAVVLFIVLTENLGGKLYPAGSPAWRRVLIPIAGSLISGYLLHRYFPNARGSGIPQTKTALFLHDGFISFRTVLGKFGLCSLSLASGIALGREGPAVHVGAGIASTPGRKLRLSPAGIRALAPKRFAWILPAVGGVTVGLLGWIYPEVLGVGYSDVGKALNGRWFWRPWRCSWRSRSSRLGPVTRPGMRVESSGRAFSSAR